MAVAVAVDEPDEDEVDVIVADAVPDDEDVELSEDVADEVNAAKMQKSRGRQRHTILWAQRKGNALQRYALEELVEV